MKSLVIRGLAFVGGTVLVTALLAIPYLSIVPDRMIQSVALN